MTGLRASHARTCAHAFAYLRAAEPVPSLLSSLLDVSGHIQGFAREKGLFRGLFRICRFFLFFQRLLRIHLSVAAVACVCLCQPSRGATERQQCLAMQLHVSASVRHTLSCSCSAQVSCRCIALPLSAAAASLWLCQPQLASEQPALSITQLTLY